MFMKKAGIYFLFMIMLLPFFSSCNNDGYSLNDYSISIATVKAEGSAYYLQLDNGEKLWPAAQDFYYKPGNGQRVWANYTILSDEQNGFDHYVKVNALSNILTKKVIDLTESNKDSIGNDNVKMFDIWFADEYINIIFGYNTSYGYRHYVNLVNNTLTESPEDGKVYLDFRQNGNGAPANFGAQAIVSFNVSEYLTAENKEVTFVISANTFSGVKQYEIKAEANTAQPKISVKELNTFSQEIK